MIPGLHLTPIGNNSVLLEPGEGLDPSAPDNYLAELMAFLQEHHADTLIYDLKTVPLIDQVYYNWLIRLYRLCLLANIEMIAVNFCSTAAFALSLSLTESPPFKCALDVESARHGIVVLA
ncbi:MAG: hypothetical protein OEY67_09560 [Gammaproteobacteria bacterium]|nr:hypothetical protein [Gammaproteobacteria bacterium]